MQALASLDTRKYPAAERKIYTSQKTKTGLSTSTLGGCIESLQTKADCIHHWLIEPSNGPMSTGVCKNCTSQKLFKTSIFNEKNGLSLEKEQKDDKKESRVAWYRR